MIGIPLPEVFFGEGRGGEFRLLVVIFALFPPDFPFSGCGAKLLPFGSHFRLSPPICPCLGSGDVILSPVGSYFQLSKLKLTVFGRRVRLNFRPSDLTFSLVS